MIGMIRLRVGRVRWRPLLTGPGDAAAGETVGKLQLNFDYILTMDSAFSSCVCTRIQSSLTGPRNRYREFNFRLEPFDDCHRLYYCE